MCCLSMCTSRWSCLLMKFNLSLSDILKQPMQTRPPISALPTFNNNSSELCLKVNSGWSRTMIIMRSSLDTDINQIEPSKMFTTCCYWDGVTCLPTADGIIGALLQLSIYLVLWTKWEDRNDTYVCLVSECLVSVNECVVSVWWCQHTSRAQSLLCHYRTALPLDLWHMILWNYEWPGLPRKHLPAAVSLGLAGVQCNCPSHGVTAAGGCLDPASGSSTHA